mmetsp:Transcript_98548/g.177950  ORF Transcript_98548/g.177950 Transcript_98548/m.177950 type:complete len:303 (-) Transcript_98548:95-1003(-)
MPGMPMPPMPMPHMPPGLPSMMSMMIPGSVHCNPFEANGCSPWPATGDGICLETLLLEQQGRYSTGFSSNDYSTYGTPHAGLILTERTRPEEEDEYEDYDNQDEVQVLVARARRLQGTNASPLERASEEMTGLDEAELEQRLTRKKNMKASFGFKSSPGALGGSGSKGFKKERMGTTMQSQDCDNMTKMLQTKLRPDVPCMVCDINTGQVLIANFHADDLFESSAATGRLIDHDLISLIAPEDRDKLSTCMTYLIVSQWPRMDTQRVHIQTLTGRKRSVHVEGSQLIASWWQLDFSLDSSTS